MFTILCVSCVTCQVSGVRCHKSGFKCQVSHVKCHFQVCKINNRVFFFYLTKWLSQLVENMLSPGLHQLFLICFVGRGQFMPLDSETFRLLQFIFYFFIWTFSSLNMLIDHIFKSEFHYCYKTRWTTCLQQPI